MQVWRYWFCQEFCFLFIFAIFRNIFRRALCNSNQWICVTQRTLGVFLFALCFVLRALKITEYLGKDQPHMTPSCACWKTTLSLSIFSWSINLLFMLSHILILSTQDATLYIPRYLRTYWGDLCNLFYLEWFL